MWRVWQRWAIPKAALIALAFALLPIAGLAGPPRAALVMDARDGSVYHAHQADMRLHPASLTKMLTLYIAFDAVTRGEIAWDAVITVSDHAASVGGARLGLAPGQGIAFRDLVLATAIRSANDAATALAEALSGSEAAFVARMNATAQRLGLHDSAFRNPHGLTASGHYSTARDMTRLARFLFFDHPDYFEIFARPSEVAGGKTILHTNRRFLNSYDGATGLKTGYTGAAGFNLTATATRDGKTMIVTVFGQPSSVARAAHVARLMDIGFARAPDNVTPQPPHRLGLSPRGPFLMTHDLFGSAGSVLGQSASDPAETGAASGSVGLSAFGG